MLRMTATALLMAGLMATSAMAAKYPGTADWQPLAGLGGDPRLSQEGQRISFRNQDARIQVELLDDPQRQAFLASADITSGDPFGASAADRRLFTFLVRIENLGTDPIQLRPQSFFMITRKPVSHATPCDFTCLLAAADRGGLNKDEAKRLMRATLDTSETLIPGQKMSKLLVFTRMPDEFKDFILDLDGLSVGSETLRVVMPYAVPKPEKSSRKAKQ